MKKIIKKLLWSGPKKKNIQCLNSSYERWIEKVEKPRQSNTGSWEGFVCKPTVSILLPCVNTNEYYFRQSVASVLAQSYPFWHLYLVTDTIVPGYIEEYIAQDERIQLVSSFFVKNEYFTFLRPFDLLAKQALTSVVHAINQSPNAALLYSDEDSLDEEGKRHSPQFKPAWNPDLFFSRNYVSHLAIIKASLFSPVFELKYSQEYDVLLHCIDKLRDDNIVHIPEVLYHRRSVSGIMNELYYGNTSVESLKHHVQSKTPNVQVEKGGIENTCRLYWPMPSEKPLVSLLIPTHDSHDILKTCIDSILKKTIYDNYEILILSNKTQCVKTLNYISLITLDKRVSVYNWDQEFNYSAINNFGVKKAKGTVIGLLNNDVEVINADWLNEMASQACRKEIGCVGAKLYYPNDTVQHAGVVLGIGGVANHVHKHFDRDSGGYFDRLKLVQNFSAVTGACLVMKKELFEQAGGLDERNLAITYNDVDLCLKVRELGFRNLWTPYAELYHHESFSRGKNDTKKKKKRARAEERYMKKHWGKLLKNDPAYNSNLSLVCSDFSIKV